MEVLMLRLDVFDELHSSLYDFWQRIIPCYSRSMQVGVVDAGLFSDVFSFNVDISQRLDSNLHTLCHSHTGQYGTLMELGQAQIDILDDFGIPHADDVKERFKYITTEKSKKYIQEYYDIEESKQLLKREIGKVESIISKEMRKFWNRIDSLIILSYKQMLYDVTGSDDLVQAFMNETRTVGIMKDLAIAKRKHDYETISDMIGALDANTGEWICDIEHLVGASQ